MHWRDPKPDKPGCYMHNHRRSAVAQLRTTVRGGGHHIYTFLFSLLNHLSSSPSPPTRRLRCKCLFLSLGSISTPEHTPLTMLLSPSIIPWVSHCPNILLLISSYSLPPHPNSFFSSVFLPLIFQLFCTCSAIFPLPSVLCLLLLRSIC